MTDVKYSLLLSVVVCVQGDHSPEKPDKVREIPKWSGK